MIFIHLLPSFFILTIIFITILISYFIPSQFHMLLRKTKQFYMSLSLTISSYVYLTISHFNDTIHKLNKKDIS